MKEYFSFNSSEIRVSISLAILILLILGVRIYLVKRENHPDPVPTEMVAEAEEFLSSLKPKALDFQKDTVQNLHSKERPVELFPFDPNSLPATDLQKLGFDLRTIQNIIKYRLAGGKFRREEDLRKIYGLSEDHYNRIKGFIQIEPSFSGPVPELQKSGEEKAVGSLPATALIDINSASAQDLMTVRGIGYVLSERIIKYRNLLGGFNGVLQLNEVYGINDSMVTNWMPFICADTSLIKKISVNQAAYRDLLRHPYIDKTLVEGIMEFREYYSKNFHPIELIKYGVMGDSCFNRLRPYLIP